jgi:hypothetical protein
MVAPAGNGWRVSGLPLAVSGRPAVPTRMTICHLPFVMRSRGVLTSPLATLAFSASRGTRSSIG